MTREPKRIEVFEEEHTMVDLMPSEQRNRIVSIASYCGPLKMPDIRIVTDGSNYQIEVSDDGDTWRKVYP